MTRTRDLTTDLLVWMGLPYGFGSTSLSKMQAMQLSAVYRCVDYLSDAMAIIPREVQTRIGKKGWTMDPDDPLNQVMNLEPNYTMSAPVMWKLAYAKVLLEGNAYIEIIRDFTGYPINLRIILDNVRIIQEATGILYYMIESTNPRILEQSDVIHLMNFSYDGLIGVSTLTHASNTLTTYDASEKHAKGYFFGGGTGSVIINVEGRLDETEAEKIKAQFIAAQDASDGHPNSAVVLPRGMSAQQFPAVPPRDAQMLESRQFQVVDICRFFGVDPVKVYETKDSKYNTVESMQLATLTDTLSPAMAKQEAEYNRKLFVPSLRTTRRIRFDEESLLRADLDSRANYRQKQFQVGTYTIDDNREAAGKTPFNTEMSQTAWVQVNMQPINKLESNGKDGSQTPGSGTQPDPNGQ